jgi:DNA polymerase-3 subunit delta
VASFRTAYLILGDDHGRITERRSRLRAMAEAESGTAAVQLLEGDACTPDAVVAALTAMTFALGRRFVIADGVERWKDADVPAVAAALGAIGEDELTIAFFGREESRREVPKALAKAVEKAGGVVAVESAVGGRQLPKWVAARAKELGVEIDTPGARLLIARVGDRQQRLLREVEKLALEHGPGARLGVEEVEASSTTSFERKVWTLGDAVVSGDAKTATRLMLELRTQGERVPSLLFSMVRRMRDAIAIAEQLEAGKPPAEVRKTLRMPSFAADRLIADVQGRDVTALRMALERLADLEMESRGGGGAALGEDTAALRAVLAATG